MFDHIQRYGRAKRIFEDKIADHEEKIKETARNFNNLNTTSFSEIVRTGSGYVVTMYRGSKLYVRVSSTKLTVKTNLGEIDAILPLNVAIKLIDKYGGLT